MKLDSKGLNTAATTAADETAPARDLAQEAPDGPEVVTHGEGRVLFGPGLDDFNAFDDPC